MRRQNLSLQSTFLIKLYQPEENPRVGQISEKDVQCFLCSVVCILNSENNTQVTTKLIALTSAIVLKNVSVIKVLECTEGRRIESRSVCLTKPNQNYP